MEEAEKKAEKIRKEAENERDEIIEKAEEEAQEIREHEEEKLEQEKESMRKKTLSSARMKAKEAKMEAKQQKIDEVFENFREYLENLSRGDRQKFVERCMEKVEFEVGRIEGSPGFEEAVDEEFRETDVEGIVVVSEDGERRQSFTFDKILEEFRQKYRREVAETLFGE